MRTKELWIKRGLMIVVLVTIWIAGFGQAVLQLWNWLMPEIFGFRPIGFWQAVGLMALSWLLFGGFRGGRSFDKQWQREWQPGMRARLDHMTPDQREKLRQGLRGRCE